jgi:hypothetical protein
LVPILVLVPEPNQNWAQITESTQVTGQHWVCRSNTRHFISKKFAQIFKENPKLVPNGVPKIHLFVVVSWDFGNTIGNSYNTSQGLA